MDSLERKPRRTSAAAEEKRRLRRAEVIDAAAAVFAEKGFHGASTKDIADRLGLRQGSLYYYFESKDAALVEVCNIGIEGHVEGMQAILAADLGAAEKFRRMIENHLTPVRDKRNYVRAFVRERRHLPVPHRHRIAALVKEYETMIQQLLQDGVADGSFEAGLDCRLVTLTVLDACNGAVQWHKREPDGGIENLIEYYAALFLQGALKRL